MRLLAVLALACALASPAGAQSVFPTPNAAVATGQVQMCLDATGKAVPASQGTCSVPTGAFTGLVSSPVSTLALTSTTTAYAANQNIASSATGASVVVPFFPIQNTAGSAYIQRARLISNDTTSTAWPSVQVNVDLWSSAPTFANGDRSTYAPTGVASWIGQLQCTFSSIVYGDGIVANCTPAGSASPMPKLPSGSTIWWTAWAATASGTVGASKTLTLVPEFAN